MLATGFTGPNVMVFMEAYIAVFNAMAEHIADHEQNLWQTYRALLEKEYESKRVLRPARTAICFLAE